LEEVAALQPDLIVVSTSPERAGDLPDYASIAPTLRAVYSASLDELAQTWGGSC
jgi:ABC-type Fe3+-hydroxamate transport system substrate-binding protein